MANAPPPNRDDAIPDPSRREWGELLDDLVHELRTPLTVIAGYAALLGEDREAIDPLLRQWATAIDQQSARLGGQLEVLLDVARLWSGRRVLTISRFDLAALGRALARSYRVDIDARSRLYFAGERALVRDAGVILLGNALRYGAPPIRIRVEPADTGLLLSVEDHGRGVPDEFVPLIGRRPFRGGAQDEQREGSGCRLLLAAAIAEAHGGALCYERERDMTRFTLALLSPGGRSADRGG